MSIHVASRSNKTISQKENCQSKKSKAMTTSIERMDLLSVRASRFGKNVEVWKKKQHTLNPPSYVIDESLSSKPIDNEPGDNIQLDSEYVSSDTESINNNTEEEIKEYRNRMLNASL